MIQYSTRKLIHLAPTLAFLLVREDAMADVAGQHFVTIGSIVYGPPPQSIPTLSGSMLVVLGLLFAVLAFRVLRAHSASKPLASIVAVGVLALGAVSGNQLIQNAQATVVEPAFGNPSGGVFIVLDAYQGEHGVRNASGQPQRIISVTANDPYGAFSTSQQPQCTVGLIVQNNSSCYINFIVPYVSSGSGTTSVNLGSNFNNTGN